MQRPARATIADVAKAAGVSKATVSRFLNHRERLLSPDIAARVEAAVAQLAYTPSPMAQALSHGRSRLIGLIVADITNPYSVAVLRGAEKACQDAGYLVMLFNLGNDIDREREAINALAGYQVDGFILNTLGRGAGLIDADADLAVAVTEGGGKRQAHPVFCLMKAALLQHLTEYLRGGGRKIDAWYASLRIAEVVFEDEDAFRNINTLVELKQYE